MATSNSTNFNMTANEIISDAFRLCKVLGVGESLSGDDYSLGLRQLNRMIKSWQAQGIHLWCETEGIVFCDNGQASFQLGGSSPDEATTEEIKTEIAAAASSGATSLTVDSTSGMAASDKIGIVVDDGTVHWTTIVSVDSSTTLTITTGIDAAAAVDNHVYAYTSDMTRPLDISSVRIENEAGNETILTKLSRADYFNIPDKDKAGLSNSFYFDRQRDFGKLYIWPVPDDGVYRLRVTFSRQIEDFDSSTDNPDLPSEWLDALTYNLAVRLDDYYLGADVDNKLLLKATDLLDGLKGWDSEHSSYKLR